MVNIMSPALPKAANNIEEMIKNYHSVHEPEALLQEIQNELLISPDSFHPEMFSDQFKALTLNEFQNGVLLVEAIPDKYRTLAISTLRRLQKEYNCQRTGEKALAELATISYIRILDLNERIQSSLATIHVQSYRHDSCLTSKDSFYVGNPNRTACQRTTLELKLLSILTKSLHQANNTYLSAIYSLHLLHQPPLQVNIKTQNTIVGHNQLVQANSHE